MSQCQKLFYNKQISKNVNDVMEALLAPVIEEERKRLISEGKAPQEIEKVLIKTKIITQAEILPKLKKAFQERLKEEENENAADIKNTNFESTLRH